MGEKRYHPLVCCLIWLVLAALCWGALAGVALGGLRLVRWLW